VLFRSTSASLARILIKRGYDRVSVLHGGFDEWIRRELPSQPKSEETRLPVTGPFPAEAAASNSSA